MIQKIKTSYRLCLKQLNILKIKDKKFAEYILNELKLKMKAINTNKQALDLTSNLSTLLTSANSQSPQNQKSIIKLVRIFTNNSLIITNKLQFSQQYLKQTKDHLKNDIQFQQLSQKDQQYVIKVVQMICEKPLGKYKTVGKYLGSPSSEKQQFQLYNQLNKVQLNENRNVLSENSPFIWALDKFFIKKQQKINQMVRQLYDNKVFLL